MRRDDALNARHRCAKGTAFSNESFSFEKRIKTKRKIELIRLLTFLILHSSKGKLSTILLFIKPLNQQNAEPSLFPFRFIGSASCIWRDQFFVIFPSPAINSVMSSILSSGNGGSATGLMAIDISFMGLSSAAIRLDESPPHLRHR